MSNFAEKKRGMVATALNYLKDIIRKHDGELFIPYDDVDELPIVHMENCGGENWPYAINELSLEDDNIVFVGVIGGEDRDCYDNPDEEEVWNMYNVADEDDILNLADFIKEMEEEEEEDNNSTENGWSGVEHVTAFLDQLAEYNYELKSCVRGGYTNCTTNEELATLLRSFVEDFEELADELERNDDQIGIN